MKTSLAQFVSLEKNQKTSVGRRLSNFSPEENLTIGNLSFSFDYKREKLQTVIHPDSGLALYLQQEGKRASKFFLLNSGQAAIILVLLWLKNVRNINRIYSPGKAYVGFYEGTKHLGLDVTYGEPGDITWICSSTFSKNSGYTEQEAKFIIIDSTCWALESDELDELVRRNPSAHILIVRSHSKLDMAGVEFGSLGSLCIISPETQGPDLSAITQELEHIIKLMGLTPSLDDVPSYLFNAEFMQLNNDRIESIKNETARIRSELGELDCSFFSYPDHGTYFFLTFPSHTSLKRQNVIVQTLFHFLSARKTEFKRIPSFGFNFLAITPYVDFSTSELVIRFAPSLEREENNKLINSLREMKELGLLTVLPLKKV